MKPRIPLSQLLRGPSETSKKRTRADELGKYLGDAERARKVVQSSTAQLKRSGRKISRQDRAWLVEYTALDFKNPELAAARAGFKTPGAGYKLELRLSDLILAAQIRAKTVAQMEMDEALMLVAEGARDAGDRKVQIQFLRTILQAHGVLSDKPLPKEDRQTMTKQVAALVESMKKRVQVESGRTAGGSVRLRAAIEMVEGQEIRQLTDGDGGEEGGEEDI